MKRKNVIILLIIIILTISAVWYFVPKSILPVPDKIIVHTHGLQKEIEKSSLNYKQIVDLTNKRFGRDIYTVQDVIDNNVVQQEKNKALGIEFIYSSEHSLSYSGFKKIRFSKLFFSLVNEKQGNSQGSIVHTVQYGDMENYKESSIGPLKYSQDLINIISEIK